MGKRNISLERAECPLCNGIQLVMLLTQMSARILWNEIVKGILVNTVTLMNFDEGVFCEGVGRVSITFSIVISVIKL